MNLGPVEEALRQALQARLGADVDCRAGPAYCGPASGLQPQVFVHAASFIDAGGFTREGAEVGRQPLRLPDGATGFAEQRPACIEFEVSCLCARHDQAQSLAGQVAPLLLEALERLAPPLLSDPSDAHRRLRFADHRAHLHAQRSSRLLHDCVPLAQVQLQLRLEGFLHVQLARQGGLTRESLYAWPLRLAIQADPQGVDLQAERVLLHNDGDGTLALGGWSLQDGARRPNIYRFDAQWRLAAGATLSLWSGRGKDDAGNAYWGRRKAVWNNTGDVALLLDPDGAERARASWSPPLPVPTRPRTRRPR